MMLKRLSLGQRRKLASPSITVVSPKYSVTGPSCVTGQILKRRTDKLFQIENICGTVLTAKKYDSLVYGSRLTADWLNTEGLYTCVAVILYNSSSQSGVLMHVGGETTVPALFNTAKRHQDLEDCLVYIIGGEETGESQETVTAIEQACEKNGIRDKLTYNVGSPAPSEIAICLKDGRVCIPGGEAFPHRKV